MKLVRLIANLGYGSRKEVARLFREGRITDTTGDVLYADDARPHAAIRIDGEPLDPPAPLALMLHKPPGYTVSREDHGALVYDLLPPRFARRRPILSSIGRLDRDTSGLLLFSDDGALVHRIISPRARVAKTYQARLAEPADPALIERFARGDLMLRGETTPLLPATLVILGSRDVEITLHEGRYHQVRRMFAACGNHVLALKRNRIGNLDLGDLAEGDWRPLDAIALATILFRDPAPSS